MLSGDLFDDLLDDDDEKPSRKNPKKKTKGSVKQPEEIITSASENEIDVNLESVEESRPSDDDDDDEEEESAGILDILNGNTNKFERNLEAYVMGDRSHLKN